MRTMPSAPLQADRVDATVNRRNPVVESAKRVFDTTTDLVTLIESGIASAAAYIARKLAEDAYTPTTWRCQPLHLCPPERFCRSDPRTRSVLNWIFLVSSLNFSFWSNLEGTTDDAEHKRFGVEWRAGWGSDERKVWTGYWSLLAAIDRAIENGIPITDPEFYSSPERCSDSCIMEIFKAAPGRMEDISLLQERIAIMRQVGGILCKRFNGSFLGFMDDFDRLHGGPGRGTALQLVKMVTDTFPSFRDEVQYAGRRVFFWKRAQILVAETWAAFYPLDAGQPHPLLPKGVQELTMFADYRVPQILHHLGILEYSPSLQSILISHQNVPYGSREELSIRAASILAVEAVRDVMASKASHHPTQQQQQPGVEVANSVLIDFYLWDLAKRIEGGQEVIAGITTQAMLPAHRTRSIWY